MGREGFLEKLQARLEGATRGQLRESHSGPARVAHDEAAAERDLQGILRLLELKDDRLKSMAKEAAEKVVLAWWLRRRTTVSLRWVSERLGMGHYTRVTQAVSRMERKPGRRLKQIRAKLEQLEKKHPNNP